MQASLPQQYLVVCNEKLGVQIISIYPSFSENAEIEFHTGDVNNRKTYYTFPSIAYLFIHAPKTLSAQYFII